MLDTPFPISTLKLNYMDPRQYLDGDSYRTSGNAGMGRVLYVLIP